MALEAGSKLGHYEVLSSLGAGGMGEVYRAKDTKLGREVAIKLLLDEVSSDPERLARFEREARVLASLNHPHIATLHGLESERGESFLVMELVEGETLADRLARGAIPVDEAVALFFQIAEGLEAAHAGGVVHRDLKPANIKLAGESARPTVKILDFGLAKVFVDGTTPGLSQSPTLTMQATRPGVVLGTAPYMSPEQARGEEADRRSDIWSFGCVLFEALGGRRPFDGATVTDILAAIVKDEPPWPDLPAAMPAAVTRLLRRCLRKNPTERLQAIGDARIVLAEVAGGSPVQTSVPESTDRRLPRWGLAAFVVVAAAAGAVGTWFFSSGARGGADAVEMVRPVTRTTLELPEDAQLDLKAPLPLEQLAITPDGRRVVYVGRSEDTSRVFVRSLDSDEVTPLAGTEGARGVFLAPDGNEVGFQTLDQLKRISLRGGAPRVLCNAPLPRTAVWTDTGRIYFRGGSEVSWIPDGGGTPEEVPLTAPEADYRFFSDVLPGGKHLLFSVRGDNVSADYNDIYAISPDTLEATLLVESGYAPRYLESGHLAFARSGHLMAVAFDPERLEVTGEPVSVVADVAMHSFFPHAQYAVSNSGTLVLSRGGDLSVGKLAWISRDGSVEFLPVPDRLYGPVDVSADGSRIAVQVSDVTDYVWIWDVERQEGRQIASETPSGWPILDREGRRVAFGTRLADGWGIGIQDLAGRAEPRIVFSSTGPDTVWPSAWSDDGSVLAFSGGALRFQGEREGEGEFPIVAADGIEGLRLMSAPYSTTFSPDGRWIAYPDEEGSSTQIWARSFPGGETVHQISVDRGFESIWCDRCDEVFFRLGGSPAVYLSARIRSLDPLAWEAPVPAFEAEYIETHGRSYDVSPDGRRILVAKRDRPVETRRIHLVQNWFEELKRLVPVD